MRSYVRIATVSEHNSGWRDGRSSPAKWCGGSGRTTCRCWFTLDSASISSRAVLAVIKHASIYDARERADGDGLRVLVMRQWPRGVCKGRVDVWLKDAAPSRALLDAYNQAGIGWDEFEQRYRSEMLHQRPAVLDQLRRLEAEHGEVTLLCHERIPPRAHCHREVLLDLLHH